MELTFDRQAFGASLSMIAMILGAYAIFRPKLMHWFELRDFVKVTYDGSWVIVMPGEEQSFIEEAADPSEYKIERVRMTMREFEMLPEFDGF